MEHMDPSRIQGERIGGPTHDEAMKEILALSEQMRVMGRNDVEPAAIKNITDALQTGAITPTAAVEMARSMIETKQDYN
jgi:hypothetical protein